MPSKKRPYADETFEIEELRSHKPKVKRSTGYIKYMIKWVGYDEKENSFEDSWQFETLGFVLKYWNDLSLKDNDPLVNEIANWHRVLHEWQKEHVFHRTDDWFVINQSKNWIDKYDWSWFFQEFDETVVFPVIGELFRKYEAQCNEVASMYENFPFIEVCNNEDDALPIPWKQLLFDIEKPDRSAAVKETIDDYGMILSLNELERELNKHRHHLRQEGRTMERDRKLKKKKNRSTNSDSDKDLETEKMSKVFPTSKVCLLLVRSKDKHWELQCGNEVIEKDTVIMPLTGELVDVSVADDCMRTEGEVVAMSGFIQLTDEFSLDRRFRSGFDRYIQHSCDPNCYVEMSFWKGRPVATVKAKKRINAEEELTLDLFYGFNIAGSNPHRFFHNRTDHVFCACLARKCREYLWVETTASGAARKSKAERLEQHKHPFYGLRVAQIKPLQQLEQVIHNSDSDSDDE